MGYANEVGEAFRALVHVNWVRLSYGVASAYVLADTNDKSRKTAATLPTDEPGRTSKIAVAAFDTLLWQALASVIIPGFTINRICAGSLYTMAKTIPQVKFYNHIYSHIIFLNIIILYSFLIITNKTVQ